MGQKSSINLQVLVIVAALGSGWSGFVYGEAPKTIAEQLAEAESSGSLVLDSETLRDVLRERNLEQESSYKNVLATRQELRRSRLAYIPGASATFTLRLVEPTWVLSFFHALLPTPSDYYRNAFAKEAHEAQRYKHAVDRMNIYTFTSNLLHLLRARELETQIIRDQKERYKRVVEILQTQYELGQVSKTDVMNAEAELEKISTTLSVSEQSLAVEKATLRNLLQSPPNEELVNQIQSVPSMAEESENIATLQELVAERSVELRQMAYLQNAAKYATRNEIVSSLSGGDGSIGSISQNDRSITNDEHDIRFSKEIEASQIARVDGAKVNESSLITLANQRKQEQFRLLAVTAENIKALESQLAIQKSLLPTTREVQQARQAALAAGTGTLREVIESTNNLTLTEKEINRVQAELDIQRTNFRRVLVKEEYQKIFDDAICETHYQVLWDALKAEKRNVKNNRKPVKDRTKELEQERRNQQNECYGDDCDSQKTHPMKSGLVKKRSKFLGIF